MDISLDCRVISVVTMVNAKAFMMFAAASTRWMNGVLIAGFALTICAASIAPQRAQAQGFSFFGNNNTRSNDRYQSRNVSRPSSRSKPAPAFDPEDGPLLPAKSDVPRPRGSDAQICANQTEDVAV